MELNDIKEFEEKLRNLTIIQMKDKEFMAELSRLYVLFGDIVISIRLPTGTRDIIPFNELSLLAQRKERWKEDKERTERKQIIEEDKSLDIPYPAGHNWEGLTPRQVNNAYKKIEENDKHKEKQKNKKMNEVEYL